mgnify:CR=1 FL=1
MNGSDLSLRPADFDSAEFPDLVVEDLKKQLILKASEPVADSIQSRLELAHVLNMLHRFEESLSVLHPLFSADASYPIEVIDPYVQALIGAGQHDVAFRWIQQLSTVSPAIDPQVMLPLLIRWAIQAERPDLAQIYLDNLSQVSCSSRIYLQLISEVALADGDKQLAISSLQDAAAQFSQSRWLKLCLADAYADALQVPRAREILHDAATQFGCFGRIRSRLIELATEEPAITEAFQLLAQEPVKTQNSLYFHRLGVLYFYRADLLNAELNLRKALEFGSDVCHETYFMLSEVLRIKGNFVASLDLLRSRFLQYPGDSAVAFSLAYDCLAARMWSEGWPLYEHRLRLSQATFPLGFSTTWEGQSLVGQTVLVLAEQGLGDVLMASSQLPQLDRQAASWKMIGFPQLEKLFRHTFGASHFVTQATDTEIDTYQVQIGICSLHHAFHYGAQVSEATSPHSFLHVDPDDVLRWKNLLKQRFDGRRCFGFAWFGGGNALNKRRRSLRLEQFLPLFHFDPDAVWISMQYGGQSVEDELSQFAANHQLVLPSFGHLSTDLYEQAALLLALDHTISVQQTLVHLAGSVGAPLWALLPTAPEWRYGNHGSSMPWYSSIKLYRQSMAFEWDDVVQQIAVDLQDLKK